MNAFAQVALTVIGVLCLIAAAILIGRARTFKEASSRGLIAVVGATAIVLTRLSDFTGFTALGMTAELRQTINEANATIAQLRTLALTIAEPELSHLAMSGITFSQLTFSYQYERKKQIVKILQDLGIPQDDITRATRVWTEVTLLKLSNVIASALEKTDKTLAEKFRAVRTNGGENKPAKPEVLSAFLRNNDVTDNEVLELVDDYKHLYDTGEVRRPEVFSVGINP